MAERKNGRRVSLGMACEALETRQLPSASVLRPAAAEVRHFDRPARSLRVPSLFTEPQDGRAPILQAIASAQHQIRLGICNLSDPTIGQALADAVARGVNVRVIVDRADYDAKPDERDLLTKLAAEGVSIRLSNPVFPQSFEKELVIDQRNVLIMTMCLVPETFEDTRDYGLVLANRAVIREVTKVFDNDWTFAAPPGVTPPPFNPTPPVHVPSLIWGPPTATAKLTQLIQQARRSIDVTTELLDDPYLESQLTAASQRGVTVRLITPLDTREGTSNAQQVAALQNPNFSVRVTVGLNPPPGALPYMHAKTMIVDGRRAYLGSIDIERVERSQDRELGILFQQPRLVSQLLAQFNSDWSRAQTPPPA